MEHCNPIPLADRLLTREKAAANAGSFTILHAGIPKDRPHLGYRPHFDVAKDEQAAAVAALACAVRMCGEVVVISLEGKEKTVRFY